MMGKWRAILGMGMVVMGILAAGCVDVASNEETDSVPTPTINPVFVLADTPTDEPLTVVTATPEVSELPTRVTAVARSPIFDEDLDPNWDMQASSDAVIYFLPHSQAAHSGNNAIAVTVWPVDQSLYFRVRQDTTAAFPRDHVIGVSLWLLGTTESIEPGNIILTVTGSDIQPHWAANDTSAGGTDEILTFSGTRAYSLGLRHAVPAGEWVRAAVLLDDLVFDPNHDDTEVDDPGYEYVTGFYVTAVENDLQNILIDDVGLIMAND